MSREIAVPRTFNVVATCRFRNGHTKTVQGEIVGRTLDEALDTDEFGEIEGDNSVLTDEEKAEVVEITLRIWEA